MLFLYGFGSVHILSCSRIGDRSWEYINRSQTHECGNWDCGRVIPFLGMFVSNSRHWFFAVWLEFEQRCCEFLNFL
jgi:hypothetical protein